MSYLFICYTREDRIHAINLGNSLRNAGYDIWLDDRINYGEDWSRRIFRAIEECELFLVIMTPEAYADDEVLQECHYAAGCRRTTIPLLLEGDSFPLYQSDSVIPVAENQFLNDTLRDVLKAVLTGHEDRKGENLAPPTVDIGTHPLGGQAIPSFLPVTTHVLTIIEGPDVAVFHLEGDYVTLGRSLENGITINDTEVSRFHCRFARMADGYMLEDLGSTNGTFVNGQFIAESVRLKHGDQIGLGKTIVLDYEVTSGERTSKKGPVSPEDVLMDTLPAGESGQFLIIYIGDLVQEILKLDRDFVTVGRVDSNDIHLDHPGISRFHCVLTIADEGYTLNDLGSTNGTFINGEPLEGTYTLKKGDMIGVGDNVVLVYQVKQ